jgi:hypothetical protein
MKKHWFTAAALALALVPAAFAATGDALSLVPTDAVSVGVVKISDVRSSALAMSLLQQTNHVSSDTDAEQFLREAGLQPMKDVDLVMIATSPKTTLGKEADLLIAADGRFNPERLGSALVTRGAVKKSTPNGSYYALPEKAREDGHNDGVVAFPDAHLALIGTEAAVIEALNARANGGTSFTTASGLGREMARIDAKASAWAIVDVARAQRLVGAPRVNASSAPGMAIVGALRGVSTVALWATDAGDSLKLGAFGLARDADTLQLVEDTLRGALAAMRLAVQEKEPDMVSVLRRFSVSRNDDSVTITGSVPAETFKNFASQHRQHAELR